MDDIETLRVAEHRFRSLCELLSDYTFEMHVSPAGAVRLVWTTPSEEALTGYGLEELNALGPLGVVHLEDLAIADRAIAIAREGGKTVDELRLITRSGEVVWIRFFVVGEPIDGEPGSARIFGAAQDITARKQIEADRFRLETHLASAQERDRQSIAAGIQEEIVDTLSALEMRLATLQGKTPQRALAVELARLQSDVSLAVRRLRDRLFDLRPPELDREGLSSAVRRLVEERVPTHEVAVSVSSTLTVEPKGDVAVAAYRIIHEALTNAVTFAKAGRVEISLREEEAGFAGWIRDDGRGFEPDQVPPGRLGLDAMRERATLVGGWCSIESRAGDGTMVEFWMPFARIGPDQPPAE
jgi:PAS domain S-box-containing protein